MDAVGDGDRELEMEQGLDYDCNFDSGIWFGDLAGSRAYGACHGLRYARSKVCSLVASGLAWPDLSVII